MPFNNPVVGGTTLVRQAINSPDYSPGVSGWTINRDGSAEFSNVKNRGEFVAGSDPGQRIELDPTGVIRIYDSSNNLVIEIDGDGFRMTDGVIFGTITGFEKGGTGNEPLLKWRNNRPALETNRTLIRCSADDALTTTATLAPGMSITLGNTAPGATWVARAAVDFDVLTASTAVAVGELWVGAPFGLVQQTGFAVFRASTASARGSVYQQWSGTCDPGGFTQFELQVRKTGATGNIEVKQTHTSLAVEIMENWATT